MNDYSVSCCNAISSYCRFQVLLHVSSPSQCSLSPEAFSCQHRQLYRSVCSLSQTLLNLRGICSLLISLSSLGWFSLFGFLTLLLCSPAHVFPISLFIMLMECHIGFEICLSGAQQAVKMRVWFCVWAWWWWYLWFIKRCTIKSSLLLCMHVIMCFIFHKQKLWGMQNKC